jgi:serine protease AprX
MGASRGRLAAAALACAVVGITAVADGWRRPDAHVPVDQTDPHPSAGPAHMVPDAPMGQAAPVFSVMPAQPHPRGPAMHAVWVWLDRDSASSDLPFAVGPDALAARTPLETDRPVNPELVARIAATGATIRYASRWLRAVSVDADSATLGRIRDIPGVVGISAVRSGEVAGGSRLAAPHAPAALSAATLQFQDSLIYAATYAPLRELNMLVLHGLGLTGSGQRIAILDTGFRIEHEALRDRRVVAQRDFINNDNVVSNRPGDPPQQDRHGTFVWSLLGAFAPTRMIGAAYDADFYLAKVKLEAADVQADEDRWVAGAEWADSLGVRIINSSVGFRDQFIDRPPIPYGNLDGNTTLTTRMADEAARRGILVVTAMGNSGPGVGTLWAPADADSVISVGAIDSLTFTRIAVPNPVSSRGPTADGRTKPELVARGGNLVGASTLGLNAYEGGLTGSSFATPFITGGAALFIQAWPDLSVMAVRRSLLLAGSSARQPNNITGFGVPDVAAAIMLPDGIQFDAGSLGSLDLRGHVTTIAPAFSWSTPLVYAQFRPIRFTLQVATDSLFNSIIYSDTVTDANRLVARAPLPPLNRAWWRVIATSRQGVQRISAPQGPFGVPPWVRLLTLNEPEPTFTSNPQPELSWAPLAAPAPVGPFVYDVQIISVATGQVVQELRDVTTSSVIAPQPLVPNLSYRWRVTARTRTGESQTVESQSPFVIVSAAAPPATILYPTYPNPFPGFGATHATIWFDLARYTPVQLAVYDTRGRLVRSLIPTRPDCGRISLVPGLYGRPGQQINTDVPSDCVLTSWDGTDDRGQTARPGVYVLRMVADGIVNVQRILFMP